MMRQKLSTTIFLAACVVVTCASPGFSQSGSRNSAPSSAPPALPSASPALPSSPAFSVPSQGFQSAPGYPAAPGISTGSPLQPYPEFGNGGVSPQLPGQPMMVAPGMGVMPGSPQPAAPGSVWEMHDPNSNYAVDHSTWDYFLSRYVRRDNKGLNRVAYRNVSRQDFQLLQGYINSLQAVDVRTLSRPEQLAYWLNLYNAQTVAIVVCKRPSLSIRQVKSKFLDLVGPFDDKVVTVLGQNLTLSEIENDIVRAVFNDPRIHYALNCASVGCPNLQTTAWTAANLDQRLNGAAYEFVNSGRAFKATLFGVKLSKIYKWYADDFGGNDAAVLQHIRQYANPQNRQTLCRYNEVMHYFYDWSLNLYGKGSNLYGVLLP